MDHYEAHHPDFGTGQKNLKTYVIGVILCSILTLIAFWSVMSNQLTRPQIFFTIYTTAIIQLFVQLIFFLRLNVRTPQGQINVMAFLYTGVILLSVVIGTLWIMWNLGYNMMH